MKEFEKYVVGVEFKLDQCSNIYTSLQRGWISLRYTGEPDSVTIITIKYIDNSRNKTGTAQSVFWLIDAHVYSLRFPLGQVPQGVGNFRKTTVNYQMSKETDKKLKKFNKKYFKILL